MESSRKELIRQKTLEGGSHQRKAVNTQEADEAPNAKSTQTREVVRANQNVHLMEQIVSKDNLTMALSRVKRNKGAPGSDGMTVDMLLTFLKENWTSIREELLNGTYQPQPVRRVEIPKPNGGVRLLGIPTVLDRLIQQAILQILTPIFDPTFSNHSYGFRPKRSAHQAIKQAQEYVNEGYRYVVDIDLERFFDRVNHDILMSQAARKIDDKRVLKAIRKYLQAGVMINGCRMMSDEGTPQGGPLSPLLANIVLHELDEELSRRKHRFVRYADDCNTYLKSKRAAERVLESISRFVERRLKLKVNKEKSAADRSDKRKILGLRISPEQKARIWFTPTTIEKFKNKVRELTRKNKSQPIEERIEKLNTYLTGWINYFSLADTRSVIKGLDEWIRRRLRACLLKQWVKPITKKRNLVALGIPLEWAGLISSSRKGCWRLSRMPQVHKGLGLAYWRDKGLISLVERYNELRCVL